MASFESFRRGVCGKRGGKPHSGSRPENWWTRRQCCRTVGHELRVGGQDGNVVAQWVANSKLVDKTAMLSHSGSIAKELGLEKLLEFSGKQELDLPYPSPSRPTLIYIHDLSDKHIIASLKKLNVPVAKVFS
ncbi:unnamed protein product [Bemisia tabaci]|uniref:Uncharacterized protein n=1 Tax=Bemisia tabaci TaxID=7038 RepID=A0A9P0A5G3_BEMTA|nr:unnamed protein product [Bemisia tabaci]